MSGGMNVDYKSRMLKIKRYSHYLRIVTKVFYWIAIVTAVGSLIASIVLKLMSDASFLVNEGNIGHMGFSIDGLIRYNFNDAALQGISMKNIYVGIAIMVALNSLLMIFVLKQLALILKSVEENRPFAKDNAKRISVIGTMFILSSFIVPASEAFVASTMIDTLKIQNLTTNYSINVILILTGFMMFILSGIFMYGSYLQREYDETV